MSTPPHTLSAIFKALLGSFKKDPALQQRLGLPAGVEATDAQRKGYVQGQIMRVLSGDYSPLDSVHPPVKEQVLLLLDNDTSTATRDRYLAEAIQNVKTVMDNSSTLNVLLGESSKDDADVIGATIQIMTRHLNLLLDAFLGPVTEQATFGGKVKFIVEEFVGEWFAAVSGMLMTGEAGATALVQMVCNEAVQNF
eukprot:PhF_6_TR8528/c0_g1_i2/m.13364